MRTCRVCGFPDAEEGVWCFVCGTPDDEGARAEKELDDLLKGVRAHSVDDEPTTLPRGHAWAGRYRVERVLGSGGMGTVYEVADERGARAALKVMLPPRDAPTASRERFEQEIKILASFRAPAVPRILAWGVQGDTPWFLTELVAGTTLGDELRKRGRYAAQDAAAIGGAVAEALAAAHEAGIVHRDVKPNNVMIGTDGKVWLLDFGVARASRLELTRITRTGVMLGTPEYMAPEQFDGGVVDGGCDVYALGVVLFQLVCGRLPFVGRTPVDLALLHRTAPAPIASAIAADVPAWLSRVLMRCLEKAPERRHGSARELAKALAREAGHGPRLRYLPTGDLVVEDDLEAEDWALVLRTPFRQREWRQGMALRFGGHYYRLEQIEREPGLLRASVHSFSFWPESHVFRGLVDYDALAAAATPGAWTRVRWWLAAR